jgi:hypothetical protein
MESLREVQAGFMAAKIVWATKLKHMGLKCNEV